MQEPQDRIVKQVDEDRAVDAIKLMIQELAQDTSVPPKVLNVSWAACVHGHIRQLLYSPYSQLPN